MAFVKVHCMSKQQIIFKYMQEDNGLMDFLIISVRRNLNIFTIEGRDKKFFIYFFFFIINNNVVELRIRLY